MQIIARESILSSLHALRSKGKSESWECVVLFRVSRLAFVFQRMYTGFPFRVCVLRTATFTWVPSTQILVCANTEPHIF